MSSCPATTWLLMQRTRWLCCIFISSEPVESLAVHEDQAAKGADSGPYALSIHGVTEAYLASTSYTQQGLIAIEHLKNVRNILSAGRSFTSELITKNPQLYPGMFPWLFPYGYGGFGNSNIKVTITCLGCYCIMIDVFNGTCTFSCIQSIADSTEPCNSAKIST